MADAFTTLLVLTDPEVSGSDNTWGTKLNNNFNFIDRTFRDRGGDVVVSGTANAIIITPRHTGYASLRDGLECTFPAAFSNTAATTLNFNGFGVKNVKKVLHSGSVTALDSADIAGGRYHRVLFSTALDAWVLMEPLVFVERENVWSATQKHTGAIWMNNAEVVVGTGTQDGVTVNLKHFQVSNTDSACALFRRQGSNGTMLDFYRNTVSVGSVAVTTTSTAYNESSDGRKKTNLRPVEDSGVIIDALEPVHFDWKGADESGTGFIAQDLAEIVPQAVTPGDDNPHLTPGMEGFKEWQMDPRKLVVFLVAECQSLRARVADLEARSGEPEK